MAIFSIREVRLSSGERISLLVSGQPLGLPVPIAARYALTQLRPSGKKQNTIRPRLRALALLFNFLSDKEIKLPERVSLREFLSTEELVCLSDRCRLSINGGVVNGSYAATRYAAGIDYVIWLSEPIIARIVNDERRDAAYTALEGFRRRARTVAPGKNSSNSPVPGERLGLLQEQRDLFLRAIHPGSSENPFGKQLQFRNYVMFLLEFLLGPRGGEVLGLKVRDFDCSVTPATVVIHRRHDDPEDTRTIPASSKTYGRLLPVDDELRDLLENWITKHRPNKLVFPNSSKHPYLFVNYKGDPLGDRGFRKIVETLRARHPQLGNLCHHILRHDWNDRWVEQSAEDNTDHAISERDQKYAMGWSHTSSMPQRYAQRAIRKSTDQKILRLQKKGLTK